MSMYFRVASRLRSPSRADQLIGTSRCCSINGRGKNQCETRPGGKHLASVRKERRWQRSDGDV